MSRRLTLYSALAVGAVLILAVLSSSPLFVDLIVRAVDVIARANYGLLLIIALLGLTIAAGAWATVVGIRAVKPVRLGKRRRVRLHH